MGFFQAIDAHVSFWRFVLANQNLGGFFFSSEIHMELVFLPLQHSCWKPLKWVNPKGDWQHYHSTGTVCFLFIAISSEISFGYFFFLFLNVEILAWDWIFRELEANQLSGEIPPELGNLANLKRLWGLPLSSIFSFGFWLFSMLTSFSRISA